MTALENCADENELFKKTNAMVTDFLMKNSEFQNECLITYPQNALQVEHGIYGRYLGLCDRNCSTDFVTFLDCHLYY